MSEAPPAPPEFDDPKKVIDRFVLAIRSPTKGGQQTASTFFGEDWDYLSAQLEKFPGFRGIHGAMFLEEVNIRFSDTADPADDNLEALPYLVPQKDNADGEPTDHDLGAGSVGIQFHAGIVGDSILLIQTDGSLGELAVEQGKNRERYYGALQILAQKIPGCAIAIIDEEATRFVLVDRWGLRSV